MILLLKALVKMMKKRKGSLSTTIFLFILLVLIITLFPLTYSRYETTATSGANIPVAHYILGAGYQYIDVSIPNLVPRATPYVYNFTIANNKDGKRTETLMEYDLKVVTTTNLELNYELYINEDYQSSGSTNKINNTNIIQDEDGTYFKEMTVPKSYFTYEYNEINNYTLLIYFPTNYKDAKYQDQVESIFIIIESKQTIQ